MTRAVLDNLQEFQPYGQMSYQQGSPVVTRCGDGAMDVLWCCGARLVCGRMTPLVFPCLHSHNNPPSPPPKSPQLKL